jgi:ornithine carbamoyltransferase
MTNIQAQFSHCEPLVDCWLLNVRGYDVFNAIFKNNSAISWGSVGTKLEGKASLMALDIVQDFCN